jgi:integrase
MAIELTEAMLTALLPPPSGRIELQDARVPELSFRVTSKDRRTWSVRARLPDGRQIRPSIGRYPRVGIAAARRGAKEMLGQISRGIDPTAEKRAAVKAKAAAVKAAAEVSPVVSERFTAWCEAKTRDWSHRYGTEVARIGTTTILPRLGDRVLTETTREEWAGLAAGLRTSTPAKAAWVYDVASSFLNYAEALGWIAVNPLPRRGRQHIAPKVEPRARVLNDVELVHVWRASARLRPKARAFARLLLLTSARESEVAGIAVGELDLITGRWHIPSERAKNKHPITVPLHPLAQAELRAIWPSEPVAAGFRLLGAVRGSGLRAPSKVKLQIDRHTGIEAWRWHDLRRTARTGMARLGIDQTVAELAVNHLSGRSPLVRTYDRYDYSNEILAALTRWQDHVATLLRQAEADTHSLEVA